VGVFSVEWNKWFVPSPVYTENTQAKNKQILFPTKNAGNKIWFGASQSQASSRVWSDPSKKVACYNAKVAAASTPRHRHQSERVRDVS
jgi:anti-sigma factor ChrR (cupin superfamily)